MTRVEYSLEYTEIFCSSKMIVTRLNVLSVRVRHTRLFSSTSVRNTPSRILIGLRRYTDSHEWISDDGDRVIKVGVSAYAQVCTYSCMSGILLETTGRSGLL